MSNKKAIRPLIKPDSSYIKLELDSRFIDFKSNNSFDFFIRIKTIYKRDKSTTIKIPVKNTKVSRKWLNKGNLKKGIRLSNKSISLIYETESVAITGNIVVGVDQGLLTVASFSDKQVTRACSDGHDLSSIQERLSRKKKGSKGFRRSQSHRENYIHWSLNQINFRDIKEVRLEKIKHLRTGRRTSRKLSHWSYTLIKRKLISLSEIEGFNFREIANQFQSQRCNSCGWTRKANRKGKTFSCNLCDFTSDSDMNAASNLELDLFKIPFWVLKSKINRNGFYWKSNGLFSISHESIVHEIQRVV